MSFRVLRNPFVIILGILIGGLTGAYCKTVVPYLVPLGHAYIDLMQLCILPIVVTSILYGIIHLNQLDKTLHVFKKWIAVFFIGLLFTGIFSTIGAFFVQSFFTWHHQNVATLGKGLTAIIYYPINHTVLHNTYTASSIERLQQIVSLVVPSNFFKELAEGLSIRLIMVVLLIGFSLSYLNSKKIKILKHLILIVRDLFYYIFDKLLYFLPFGLICLVASNVAFINKSLFDSVVGIIFSFYLLGAMFLLLTTFLVTVFRHYPMKDILWSLKKMLSMIFFLNSAFIAIPAGVEGLGFLGVHKELANLGLSLGISLNRVGTVFLFSTVAIFMATLYHIPITGHFLLLTLFLSILTGFATAGRGASLKPMFSIITLALGLPLAPSVLVLIVIDPFVTRLVGMISMYFNALLILYISPNHREIK